MGNYLKYIGNESNVKGEVFSKRVGSKVGEGRCFHFLLDEQEGVGGSSMSSFFLGCLGGV